MKLNKPLSMAISILLIATPISGVAAPNSCSSSNKIWDVTSNACYACMFPIYVASVPLMESQSPVDDDSDKVGTPICYCPEFQIGIPVGYWNPGRFDEAVKTPWCFPLLGLDMNVGFGSLQVGTSTKGGTQSFMQGHWYIFPLMYLLELLTDYICIQKSSFDVGYLTEIDPLWDDEKLSIWVFPETLLFANPVSMALCTGDSISANISTPLSSFFWCKGSWGGTYPLTGHSPQGQHVEESAAVAANLIAKLQRQLIIWNGAGNSALCGRHPQPIWNKDNYRMQLMLPNHSNDCMVIGEDATFKLWGEGGKNMLGSGMDQFGYLIFQKRDCCAF